MTQEEAQGQADAKIKAAQALLEEAVQVAVANQLDLYFELGRDANSPHSNGPFKFEFHGGGKYPDTDWCPGGWVGSSYDC